MREYRDRQDAGRRLALRLREFANRNDVLVVALPRGGVPVAYEVARALRVPMEVLPVRQLGAPQHPELAIGAIASGDVHFVDRDVTSRLGVTASDVLHAEEAERPELDRREVMYRGGRAFPDVHNKTVILVDDGLAAGATMIVAVETMRKWGAGRVIAAVPVAAPDTYCRLRAIADDCVCPTTHLPFGSVSQWYDDFTEASDAELIELAREGCGVRTEL